MNEQESARRRILRWRQKQPAYARMPEELWAAAVALARVDGVYAVARELGLSYAALKRRVGDSAVSARSKRSSTTPFMEIDVADVLGGGQPGSVVEISRADGAKLTVCTRDDKVDVVALADAFLRHGG